MGTNFNTVCVRIQKWRCYSDTHLKLVLYSYVIQCRKPRYTSSLLFFFCFYNMVNLHELYSRSQTYTIGIICTFAIRCAELPLHSPLRCSPVSTAQRHLASSMMSVMSVAKLTRRMFSTKRALPTVVDHVVVGGGIAGCGAAVGLAQSAGKHASVLILEYEGTRLLLFFKGRGEWRTLLGGRRAPHRYPHRLFARTHASFSIPC